MLQYITSMRVIESSISRAFMHEAAIHTRVPHCQYEVTWEATGLDLDLISEK